MDRGINGYPSGAARTALDGAEVDRQPVPFVADDAHHHILIRMGTALPLSHAPAGRGAEVDRRGGRIPSQRWISADGADAVRGPQPYG